MMRKKVFVTALLFFVAFSMLIAYTNVVLQKANAGDPIPDPRPHTVKVLGDPIIDPRPQSVKPLGDPIPDPRPH